MAGNLADEREEIKNPHRIFPGDVIVLERDAQGSPRLRLQSARLVPQIYSTMIEEGIPAIPPNVIRPFLSDPLIVEAPASTARRASSPRSRIGSTSAMVTSPMLPMPIRPGWTGRSIATASRCRTRKAKEILGYEAFYLGTARQSRTRQSRRPSKWSQ
jgi:hypothetical protein